MTQEEFDEMCRLLQKYCSTLLDQWTAWVVSTPVGDAYIEVSQKPNLQPEHYDRI